MSRVDAVGVLVRGRRGLLLAPTSLRVRRGEVSVVAGEPGAGHTALSLALGGRLRPDSGRVLLDGRPDDAGLRRAVALVDTPGVSEPDDALPLAAVVGEELAMAGRRAGRRAVVAWLERYDAAGWARRRVDQVPPPLRVRLLAGLAVVRPGVHVLVLTCPDRWGGHAADWLALADELAAAGPGVVLQLTDTSAHLTRRPLARIGCPATEAAAHEPVDHDLEVLA